MNQFTAVLTYDDGQAEDEESSLLHMDGFQSKLPPGILPHGMPQVTEVQPAVTQEEKEKVSVNNGKNSVSIKSNFVLKAF